MTTSATKIYSTIFHCANILSNKQYDAMIFAYFHLSIKIFTL